MGIVGGVDEIQVVGPLGDQLVADVADDPGPGGLVLVDPMPEPDQTHFLCFDATDEVGNRLDATRRAQLFEHPEGALVRAPVARPREARHARRHRLVGVRARARAEAHGRGGGVLFVFGVKNESCLLSGRI